MLNSTRSGDSLMWRQLAATVMLLTLLVAEPTRSLADDGEIAVERTENGARVTYNGELFAEYLTRSGQRPIVWPLIGPTGESVTRGYPMKSASRTEESDHPHHRSLWFGHEGIGGTNTWHEPRDGKLGGKLGEQVHREFARVESDGNQAVISTVNDWRNAKGEKRCEDRRTLRFFANDEYRWIDFMIQLTASEGDIEVADTKEGSFAVRVAGTMKVDSKPGGQIVNSRGQKNGGAWGRPAEWVDYHGPVSGTKVGIAILSHPTNFRAAPRWHVREYGLFAANPFGERHFPKDASYRQGAYTIREGKTLQLRYRVVLHKGDETEGRVAEHYRDFAAH